MSLSFDFVWPLTGGVLIGLAAVLMLWLLGRIAGISGILWTSIVETDRHWRLAFIGGLILGPVLAHFFLKLPIPESGGQNWLLIIVAGLLVGFGTRLGSGCTSGHGVCGLGRRSPRSLSATLTFMATGILTVFIVRHLLTN
ncbi:YeeE/YedE family protein [Hahella ganghwensis]|uniref:YeeE/YedE family protein n=1 Tax=Hahella ganghwensis TaxID=286420 RepID=UPI00035D5B4C|nr:YeeE/YedE family protein [Hahella ganghwensis]